MAPSDTAAPLTFEQLVAGTEVTRRTLRRWTQAGLLRPPELRGPRTVYPAAHRPRVLAIVAMRAQSLTLDQIHERLIAAPPAEPAAPAPEPAAPAPDPAPAPMGEAWERVALLPGLELHVRAGGGALVRRIAEEIVARYAARG